MTQQTPSPDLPQAPEAERQALMLRPLAEPNALVPQTLGQALEWANILCRSSIVPKAYQGRPADVLVCILYGKELGMSVTQSLQNVAVVNGRATIWGDGPLGIVYSRAGDQLESFEEGWDPDLDKGTAWCKVKRRGRGVVHRTFSIRDAEETEVYADGKTIRLIDKGAWRGKAYQRRMAKFKARNEALRDAFPDILLGIAGREDADEWAASAIDAEVVHPETAPPTRTVDEMLAAMPTETAEAVRKGFDTLALSLAERRVWLKKYEVNEHLLKALRDEAMLRKSQGQKRYGEGGRPGPKPVERPADPAPERATDEPTEAVAGEPELQPAASADEPQARDLAF